MDYDVLNRNIYYAVVLCTGMHWWTSVYRGSARKVRRFILGGVDIHQRQSSSIHQTPLHVVLDGGNSNGHIQVFVMLLDHGVDIHGRDDLGNTPLHVAAMKGRTDMALMLLKRGAILNCYNNEVETPTSLSRKIGWYRTDRYGWHPTHCIFTYWEKIRRWQRFVKYSKRLREMKYIWLLWIRCKISCDINHLVCWL